MTKLHERAGETLGKKVGEVKQAAKDPRNIARTAVFIAGDAIASIGSAYAGQNESIVNPNTSDLPAGLFTITDTANRIPPALQDGNLQEAFGFYPENDRMIAEPGGGISHTIQPGTEFFPYHTPQEGIGSAVMAVGLVIAAVASRKKRNR